MNVNRRMTFVIAITAIIALFSLAAVGCAPSFASAPEGLSADNRKFTKIRDERMFAEAENYAGYIYKSGGEAFCLRLKSPKNVEAGKAYPLVVFLHGYGDWGTDNSSHMYRSLIDAIEEYAPDDCYVFMPQAIKDRDWSENGQIAGGGMDRLYNECLDYIIGNEPIDKDRVYLTGMSMGGLGTLYQGARYSEKYAALLPVCGLFYDEGWNSHINSLENLIDKPIWFIHSKNDNIVPFENSSRMSSKLKEMGNAKIKTRWLIVPKHDITSYAYDSAEVWDWLFNQKR